MLRLLRPKRKERYAVYTFRNNGWAVCLFGLFFVVGLSVSLSYDWMAAGAYLFLWALSYLVVFAGTCRGCVYYGKRCPVPGEGGCVQRVFEKKEGGFGTASLFWAEAAYLLRIGLPAFILVHTRAYRVGAFYIAVLILFCFFHLRVSGCPHCANSLCPLNPDYEKELYSARHVEHERF